MEKVLLWKTVCNSVTSASGELGRDKMGGCLFLLFIDLVFGTGICLMNQLDWEES